MFFTKLNILQINFEITTGIFDANNFINIEEVDGGVTNNKISVAVLFEYHSNIEKIHISVPRSKNGQDLEMGRKTYPYRVFPKKCVWTT